MHIKSKRLDTENIPPFNPSVKNDQRTTGKSNIVGYLNKMLCKFRTETGVVTGVCFKNFNPKKTALGIGKASGGIVYFNVLGKRVNTDIANLHTLTPLVRHLGQIRTLVTDCEEVFAGATPGPKIPWKGLLLQEYVLSDGKIAYTLPMEKWNA